ncbi:Bifunctional protein NCOAT [Aphelenchoides bicaudatus]|nr:Bifunctional protein NCOAT [Aphelenchoides bicaudatus]
MGNDERARMQSNGSTKRPKVDFICGIVEGFYGRPWTNEQRKNLFERMKVMGLNTYMYGPKDDLKHRFEWRSLYNEEEIELLRSLIQSANMNNVNFVYSISPGIDIVYSRPTEIKAIIRKLKQVEELGCRCFALLFDDIEITMNEEDSKVFSSFVAAQIAVTNEVYAFMDSDMFFFCPTEYCSTRAIPNVSHSSYLNTLGKDLSQGIEIFWTGPQVVSPELTAEHAKEVAQVLKRKALIWDNLHANDYDPKRVFLGPLDGRPVELKNQISGLLLNPNCKFEANFVPFYTLSIWNKSIGDGKSQSDSEEEMTGIFPSQLNYRPAGALNEALDNWLELYLQNPNLAIPPISQIECTIAPLTPATPEATTFVLPPTIRTCEANDLVSTINGSAPPLYTSAIGSATTLTVQAYPVEVEEVLSPQENEIADEALLTANSMTTDYGETVTESNPNSQTDLCSTVTGTDSDVSMDVVETPESRITHEQLSLLVDVFYLPFNYGKKALELLEDFQFMHKNCHILRRNSDLGATIIAEWNTRFDSFQEKTAQFEQFFRLFLDAPNRALVQELFAYVSDAHAIITTLSAILKWMKAGNLVVLPNHNIESWWTNKLTNVEPWAFGNGLLPDLQKLIICSQEVANLFLYKTPIPLIISSYQIEPLNANDLDTRLFYEIFAYQQEKNLLEEISTSASADLFFDRCFGLHLKNGRPEHNFQINEIDLHGESSLFAVLTTIFSVPAAMDMIKTEFLNSYRDKYAEMLSDDKKAEEMFLKDVDNWPIFKLPASFLEKYPSFIELRWRNHVQEAAWCRRQFVCACSALAMNGSGGLFMIVPEEDEERINLLYRFGLSAVTDVKIEKFLIMAHLL